MGNIVKFSAPPLQDELHVKGRVYSPGGPAPLAVAQNPALLNEVEAELAIVRFDREKNTWRLVRDFGATPLYYALTKDGFIWSFSYRGLLDLLEQTEKPRPDEAVLFDYLATHYRHIFREPSRTFHEGVFQVPAGAYLEISSYSAATHVWADFSVDEEAAQLSPDEATARLMEILRENVRLRARAARRPAFTVSSGLDSSTVACLASEDIADMRVFSVGYEGAGTEEFDETEGVAELVKGKDWQWRHLRLPCPDLIAETQNLIGQTRSPISTVTWLAYYLMAREFSDGHEISAGRSPGNSGYEIFNGIGGDECLAGEFLHFFYFFADLKAGGFEARLAAEAEGWSRLHDHPVFKKNREVLEDFWRRNIDFKTGETRVDQNLYQLNRRFFNPGWWEAYGPKDPPLPRPYPGYLSNRLYQEWRFETTPPTLWGLFMANELLGLTGVSPFLSPRLFRFCLSLPGRVKYENGLTKALLRRGLSGVLPESLRLNHKKTGFNAPIHQWFNNAGVAKPLLELLRYGPLTQRGWLAPGAADQILREHETLQANHMMLLWPLLNTSLFLGG